MRHNTGPRHVEGLCWVKNRFFNAFSPFSEWSRIHTACAHSATCPVDSDERVRSLYKMSPVMPQLTAMGVEGNAASVS